MAFVANGTQEAGPLADLHLGNYTPAEEAPYSAVEGALHVVVVVADLAKFGLCVATVAATVLLLYVLAKFKQLRTPANHYLIHYAVANLLYFLFIPLYNVVDAVYMRLLEGRASFCVLYQVELASLFLGFAFTAAMAANWYVLVLGRPAWRTAHVTLRRCCVALIYALAALKFVASSYMCFGDYAFFSSSTLKYVYLLELAVVAAVNCARRRAALTKQQQQLDYVLRVATYIALMWLPLFVYHSLYQSAFGRREAALLVLSFTDWMPEFLVFSGPIIVVYMLGRWNKHFKMAYDAVFRPSVKAYADEDLDGESDDGEGDEGRARGGIEGNAVQVTALTANGSVDQTAIFVY